MANSERGYLLLADGSIRADSGTAPGGLYLRGTVKAGRFTPEGKVEGKGELGNAGQPGWMELADGKFHGDQTARPPFPPYIRGYRSPSGEFRPASREVTW